MARDVLTISPSLEDYLESIFMLRQRKQMVRVKDLAEHLKIKASSVVGGLRKLQEKHLVVHEHYGYIELTQEGINKAKAVYERHVVLKKFLHQILGVDKKVAEQDACKIEHYLSKKTLERIVKFINFIETCPQGEPEWLNNFYYFVKHKKRPPECNAKFLVQNSQNNVVKLSDLKVGEKGKILKITDTGILKSKLLGLGFVKGEIVKIEKVAPLGSPIDILIKNTHISLRKEEAEKIIVEDL